LRLCSVAYIELPKAPAALAARQIAQREEVLMSNGSSLAHPAAENGVGLATLDLGASYITIINTYTVAPEHAPALQDLLICATAETIRYVPASVSENYYEEWFRCQPR
jgi:hypothetical protein